MKNPIGTEDCGNQVYVITIDDTANGECLRDFLEQEGYTFFTASEDSESFRYIQEAMLRPQGSAQENDSAPNATEELPKTGETIPSETALSRSDFHGDYGHSGVRFPNPLGLGYRFPMRNVFP